MDYSSPLRPVRRLLRVLVEPACFRRKVGARWAGQARRLAVPHGFRSVTMRFLGVLRGGVVVALLMRVVRLPVRLLGFPVLVGRPAVMFRRWMLRHQEPPYAISSRTLRRVIAPHAMKPNPISNIAHVDGSGTPVVNWTEPPNDCLGAVKSIANCVSSVVNTPAAADTGPKEPSSKAAGKVCEASNPPLANVLSVVGPGSLVKPLTVKVLSVLPRPAMSLWRTSIVSSCDPLKPTAAVASSVTEERSALGRIGLPCALMVMLAKFASLAVSEAAPVVIPVPLSNTSICSVAAAGTAVAARTAAAKRNLFMSRTSARN